MSLQVFRDRLARRLAEYQQNCLYDRLVEGMEDALNTLNEYINEFTPDDSEELIRIARQEYGNNECEIDNDCEFSENDEGCWVGAWVFVSHEDVRQDRKRRKGSRKTRKEGA